jgi:chitin disaccharide deacetylase
MNISICADDIGQDIAITDAAIALFTQQRLNKISVLIDGPVVQYRLSEICALRSQGLQVGLHFNLTLPFAKNRFCLPLNQLIILSQLRMLPTSKIAKQIDSQMKLFEDTFQFKPDFLDGHQHVHQFPQIRDKVIAYVKQNVPLDSKFWIRSTRLPFATKSIPEQFKCNLLNILGGHHFQELLKLEKIHHNQGFLGVYGFNARDSIAYRSLMQKWLGSAQDNTLIMCHPATHSLINDAIGQQRPIEYSYLISDQFLQDLKEHHCQLI